MTEVQSFDSGRAAAARLGRGGLAVHGLLLLSGFAGLGYQVVWIRMLSTGLGHEIFAMLAVVAAFFTGLALGAALLDRRIARSRRPGLWYAGLEALIGVWTLALIALIPPANAAMAAWMGPDPSEPWRWTVAFFGPLLLLLPSTVAMGATLPAAERLHARLDRDGKGVGGLYAANLAGAMAGALLTAVWLTPALGFSATLLAFAAVNAVCALGALLGPARGEAERPALPAAAAGAGPSRGLLAALFVTGLLGVGYEVAVARALSQLLQNTVYSFAATLTVYLLCAALGSAAYQRLYAARRRAGWDAPALRVLVAATAAAGALGALALFAVPPVYEAARAALGGGVAGSIGAELVCSALTFGPASAAMGALFAHLAQGARGPGGGLGAAFAANTLGGAIAPLLVGVIAAPALGAVGSMLALSLGYLGFAALTERGARSGLARRAAPWLLAPAIAALVLAGPFDRRLVAAPEGGRVLLQREGVAGTATVTEDAGGDRWLLVNGAFVMGGAATYRLDRIQGHSALLRHPAPKRALFLGVGTGATLAAAAVYPDLRTEGVELMRAVLETGGAFAESQKDIDGAAGRITLHVGDARRWARASETRYDVILSDNFHPSKDGAGFLYTVEHFQAVRERLAEGGVFAQWLPLHQLDLPTLKLIARSFLAAFPDASLALGNNNLGTPILALYGSKEGGAPKLLALARREMTPELIAALNRVGLDTPFALFGGFLAGPKALAEYVGPGPLNRDDHPLVLFEAPRAVYETLPPAQERLLALLDAFHPAPREAVDLSGVAGAAEFEARLAAYWRARDAFIRLGAARPNTGDPLRDAQAIAPKLLEIAAMSPDFRPAYDPLLRMAEMLVRIGRPSDALGLLKAMEQAAPERPEAGRFRQHLLTPRERR